MKLLTIVIPTHNRSKFLSKSLNILLPQIELYKEAVDLLVSDNCSDDDTREVVMGFKNRFTDCLIYNCNDKDEGYLFNFNIGVHLSNSEYIYLLGDDDIVPDGFVSSLLEIIQKNEEVGLFHINYLQFSNRLSKLKLFYSQKSFGKINEKYDFRDFLTEFYDGPTFMSSLVFKKDIWLKGENKYKEDCYGYDWLMKIFAGCDGCKCLYHNMPMMIQVDSNTNPYNDKWALYSIVGKSRIFKNLDTLYHGIYKGWLLYHNTGHQMTLDVMSVCYDKKRYKEEKEMLLSYIPLLRHKILFFLTLYFFPRKLVTKVMIPFVKGFSILEKYVQSR